MRALCPLSGCFFQSSACSPFKTLNCVFAHVYFWGDFDADGSCGRRDVDVNAARDVGVGVDNVALAAELDLDFDDGGYFCVSQLPRKENELPYDLEGLFLPSLLSISLRL